MGFKVWGMTSAEFGAEGLGSTVQLTLTHRLAQEQNFNSGLQIIFLELPLIDSSIGSPLPLLRHPNVGFQELGAFLVRGYIFGAPAILSAGNLGDSKSGEMATYNQVAF